MAASAAERAAATPTEAAEDRQEADIKNGQFYVLVLLGHAILKLGS